MSVTVLLVSRMPASAAELCTSSVGRVWHGVLALSEALKVDVKVKFGSGSELANECNVYRVVWGASLY